MSIFPDSIDSLASYAQQLSANPPPEPSKVNSIISALGLQPHPEGGYFVETDRDSTKIPNPFVGEASAKVTAPEKQDNTRNTSTSIFHLLSPGSPFGTFHRNKSRTIHTLHSGRGCYVIVHADEAGRESGAKARVEMFLVGHDVANGERLQWIVEGSKFKASFLLPDRNEEQSQAGLLISETVTPGFEFSDYEFMTASTLNTIATVDQIKDLSWLIRKSKD